MSELIIESAQDGVVLLRLNRPDARNALNLRLRQLLAEAFSTLSTRSDARVIVITGGEKSFAAGADLKEIVDQGAIDIMLRGLQRLWQPIADCPLPVIAAVQGVALGAGCELAMHADIIIAGEGAEFGQPEIRVGIMPGAGGTQRLLRAVGKYKAMHMLLTGQPVGAKDAESMGLVSKVVADDLVLETALQLARSIAGMPPIAVAQIKEAVLAGADAPLASGLALERKSFQLLFDTADQEEGMKAFLEKRRPQFRGR